MSLRLAFASMKNRIGHSSSSNSGSSQDRPPVLDLQHPRRVVACRSRTATCMVTRQEEAFTR
jgi:hypothetical protein